MNGFDVDVPLLARVPPMFEDLASSAEECRVYAEEAYAAMDRGQGPWRNMDAGIINQLTFTHNRIRRELQGYFGGVRAFADEQGDKVRDAVELYRTTDRELAETLDQTLFDRPTQDDVRSVVGRLSSLDLDARVLQGPYLPADPASHLRPPPDYRGYEPSWRPPLDTNDELSAGSLARDLIWHGSSFAARFGVGRPLDIVSEVVVPFTGDWAALKACGDALRCLDRATGDLYGNTRWIADWINSVWQGNAADACWLHVRQLERSLNEVTEARNPVLVLYADAYHDVVDEVQRLERIAGGLAEELLDWVASVLLTAVPPLNAVPELNVIGKIWSVINPPDAIFQIGKLVFDLLDTVRLAVQAVWDFNARCELGALVPVNGQLPGVPAPSVGYH
jgi:hypothetical protein